MDSKRPRPVASDVRPDRGDVTRQKLLLASIDVFGRRGFDGTTTRALADAAGVNLQAIPYYFGGKEGLYIAVAEHIAAQIASHVELLRDRVRSRITQAEGQGIPVGPEEAREHLTLLLQKMATLFVGSESEGWARFLIREQMEPTEAFRRVYGTVMGPTLEVARRLMGIILSEDPASEHVVLRTLSLLGGIMVFRTANAAAMTQLGWKTVGAREVEAVQALARELVASIGPQGGRR